MKPLNEVLGHSLGRGFLNFTAQKLRIFEAWPQVVGPEAAAKTKADLIHEGRLTVLVAGPAWLERFNYQKAAWIKALNIERGCEAVREIIFKVEQW